MRILLLRHSFNSLTQRFFVELRERGEEERAIPGDVLEREKGMVVHPGPPGDRGPCAHDRAILEGRENRGVTLLEAARLGLVDIVPPEDPAEAEAGLRERAQNLAATPDFAQRLAAKRAGREDEASKPLEQYRAEEMEKMRRNFFGCDPSYHVARHNFIRKVAKSRTPLHLALHRSLAPRRDIA